MKRMRKFWRLILEQRSKLILNWLMIGLCTQRTSVPHQDGTSRKKWITTMSSVSLQQGRTSLPRRRTPMKSQHVRRSLNMRLRALGVLSTRSLDNWYSGRLIVYQLSNDLVLRTVNIVNCVHVAHGSIRHVEPIKDDTVSILRANFCRPTRICGIVMTCWRWLC